MMPALLEVKDLHAGYDRGLVLRGVDLNIERGQVLAVLGRNGVGKTTLVHTLMGLVRSRTGSIHFDGQELAGRPPHLRARAGIALVPQGRRNFARLTVEENLGIASRSGRGGWNLQRVYALLPKLAERRNHRGDQLSGGEQQMLAIGRALLGEPRLLLLDEPSEGLAPLVVQEITRILSELRAEGLSALLVEQHLRTAFELADTVHIMSRGSIVYRASVDEFRRDPETARVLLGVS
jgi:branched-chain amino acid transport system ATP-binding protein